MRILLFCIVLASGSLAAQGFDSFERVTPRNIFAAAEGGDADSEASAGSTFEQLLEQSQWRGMMIEGWGGIVAAKYPMWEGGFGFAFDVWKELSVAIRLEYNHDLGSVRTYRPQLRTLLLEPGVRFHLDFDESVAFFSNHGPSITAQLASYALDERADGTDQGTIFSLGLGTAHTIGLEFGPRDWRGFVETGLRTEFVLVQSGDREVRGFRDNLRDDFRFQWIVLRGGVRFYF